MSGASGLVGRSLQPSLREWGYEVVPLVRRAAGPGEIAWDTREGVLDIRSLEGFDAVIHLAGESIAAKRWRRAVKTGIRESRVRGTRLLCEGLAALERPPEVLLAASAIGFYGDGLEAALDEGSPQGKGFLAEVCADWEGATAPAKAAGVRVVNLRIGVVLTPKGGALAKMLTPFKLGLGGPIGTGRQYVSWIALGDLLGALGHCLREGSLSGPVNATAPGNLPQHDFARTLAHVLHRPAFVPMPGPVVRLLMGKMGQALLLEGARVQPSKLLHSGFTFSFPTLEGALRHELCL